VTMRLAEFLAADRVDAPWTKDQVRRLNEFQEREGVHPFTCPGPPEGSEEDCPSRNLIATPDGWLCACRRYTQSWAHRKMIEEPSRGDDPSSRAGVEDRPKGRRVVRRGRRGK
jgi:hypothetical protein